MFILFVQNVSRLQKNVHFLADMTYKRNRRKIGHYRTNLKYVGIIGHIG